MAVALDAVWLRVKNVCKQNGLLILSVLAVVIGCLLGFFLRTRGLSEQVSPPAVPDHASGHTPLLQSLPQFPKLPSSFSLKISSLPC
ncbi:hypothetical protein AGOR_G00150400 [Albula goreensis]|uniref:Uncharacterized protein n=1 Tax=Albula goreensis TaxID=1534307 RepID=A0A8T3D5Z1_9TELE|nr:hypothetical protein AGOR_G00150400 [Albula goreensis]